MAQGNCPTCGVACEGSLDKCPACEHQRVCRVCFKPIPLGAKKCTECDCYQAWWRLDVSSAFVAAVSAFISTLVALVALLSSAFVDESSETSYVRLDEVNANGLTLLLRNDGNRAAFVLSSEVRYTYEGGGVLGGQLKIEQPADRRVPAGELTVVRLRREDWPRQITEGEAGEATAFERSRVTAVLAQSDCTLVVEVDEFGDADEKLEITCNDVLDDLAAAALGAG